MLNKLNMKDVKNIKYKYLMLLILLLLSFMMDYEK